MKKTEKKTKEELGQTEELCCSDSNLCSLDCSPKSKNLTEAMALAANEKRALLK
jgi:hypothetical protein